MERKEVMTFPEFESKCQQWFDRNKHRFMLSDLRIWRTVPGFCNDSNVWYCLVNIRKGVNMIEEKQQNLGKMIDLERLSFLECLEKLDNWRNDPTSEWHGRKMTIFRHDSMSEVICTMQL